MKSIGIFGASGFAREVGDVADALGLEPIYIAENDAEIARWSFGAEIIPEADVCKYPSLKFAIGVGSNSARRKVAERYKCLTYISLIHPAATFGVRQRVAVEESTGAVICAGARLMSNITLGAFCIVSVNATVGHDVTLGSFVNISPGASVSGNVAIADGCLIGSGAVINQGGRDAMLEIGTETVIGSGAVVVRKCEANAVYVGVPARRIK